VAGWCYTGLWNGWWQCLEPWWRHGLRHDPWWSWILTFRRQRRKWHEPRWILACLEPPAWQPGQSCYEPLHTKPCSWRPEPELQPIKPNLPADVTITAISLISKLQPNQPSVLSNKPLILTDQPKLQPHFAILFTYQPELQSNQSQLQSNISIIQPNKPELLSDKSIILSYQPILLSHFTILLAHEPKLLANQSKLQPYISIIQPDQPELFTNQSKLQSYVALIFAYKSKLLAN